MAYSTPVTYKKGKLYNLNLAEVQPDPDQPRKFFDGQALSELKSSIEKHGVLQPVLMRQGADGGLLLVSGERRYQAAKLAGLRTIPAVFTDGEPTEISIVENLLRENLTAIEEAEAIDRLKARHNYLLSDLSAALGKSDSTLSEILSLTKLPDEIKNDCRNDPKTARGILVEIAKKKNPATMMALYAKYKERGLTRGEIRKRSRTPKAADAAVDLGFISAFIEKLDRLDVAKMDQAHKDGLSDELRKLRGFMNKKIKLLNG